MLRRSRKLGRKSRENCSDEFLLDTSYVLPLVGIEVRGIDGDTYSKILAKKLYYPIVLVAELVGVIAKEVKKARIDVPEEAVEGFNAVIFGSGIEVVLPEGDDVKIASEVVKTGWNDVFDALLYATAKRLGVRALTMDKEFKKFLRENGYDADLLVGHEEVDRW